MNEKDIFKVFQANEQVWDETPNERAWQRLEQRLDRHRREARVVRFRRLAVAASLLLVLGAVSVMALQSQQERARFAALEETYQTSDLEEVYVTDATDFQPIQYAKAGVIDEGSPTRRLVAAMNYFYVDEVEESSQDMMKILSDTLHNVAKSILPAKRDFTWLLGDWVGKIADGKSIEQWEQVSEDVYDGTGFLVKNADTLFMEQMRLQRKGESWYYILQSDAYAQPVAYKMSYYSPDFIVFENPKIQFPNQVVFDRRMDTVCSTVFLPKGKIQLSTAQLDFWIQRNVLLQDKAVRNLWKSI